MDHARDFVVERPALFGFADLGQHLAPFGALRLLVPLFGLLLNGVEHLVLLILRHGADLPKRFAHGAGQRPDPDLPLFLLRIFPQLPPQMREHLLA